VNYQVSEKKGPELTIALTELGENQFELTIENRSVRVDAVKSGRTIYSVIEDGKQFEVMVDEKGQHGFDVLVAGRLFHLEAVDERTQVLAQAAHAVLAGKQTVCAEMPGKVVKLCVAAGAQVSEGQGVVIVEAMKMENEIPSPIDGVVTEIAVGEGATVEGGAVLFVVEPPEEDEG
jgi:biotin carboxyl carrier protein